MYMAFQVGAGRGKYNVEAPAISGNPTWERLYRVQVNTVEQLVVFLRSIQLDQAATTAQIDSGLRAGTRRIVTSADPSLAGTDAVDDAVDAVGVFIEAENDPTCAFVSKEPDRHPFAREFKSSFLNQLPGH